MTAILSTVIKQETYLGYEILVETFGHVATSPREVGSLQTHHTTQVSVWQDGKEIPDARETPSLRFVSQEDAAELGFEIGRMIVTQRSESSAPSLTTRVSEFFKQQRLSSSSLRA